MIAGLLLAAGRGERFGGNKLVAALNGIPIIRRSFAAIAGLESIHVVTPQESSEIREALAGLKATFVVNNRPHDGMASSIRCGVASLPAACAAVVIALGDQPFASEEVTARLIDEWMRTGAPAVVPRYQNGPGHPVLFDRETFPTLCALEGDTGAKSVLRALGDRVSEIDIGEDVPEDVDTREILSRMESQLRPNS